MLNYVPSVHNKACRVFPFALYAIGYKCLEQVNYFSSFITACAFQKKWGGNDTMTRMTTNHTPHRNWKKLHLYQGCQIHLVPQARSWLGYHGGRSRQLPAAGEEVEAAVCQARAVFIPLLPTAISTRAKGPWILQYAMPTSNLVCYM